MNASKSSVSRKLLLGVACIIVFVGTIAGGRWIRTLSQRAQKEQSKIVQPSQANLDTELISRAEIHFGQYCSKCHGERGHGDGEGLQPLTIRPRDFRSNQWKFAKTRASIEEVIRNGISGTPMPASNTVLSDNDISNLAALVLEFGDAENSNLGMTSDQRVIDAGLSLVIPGPVPNLEVVDTNESSRELNELCKGPTIIHFWGTSCVHCIKAFPELNHLIKELEASGISVVSICGDQIDTSEISEFAEEFPNFNFYVSPTGLAMNRFKTSLLPTIFLVDDKQTVIGKTNAPLTKSQIQILSAAFD